MAGDLTAAAYQGGVIGWEGARRWLGCLHSPKFRPWPCFRSEARGGGEPVTSTPTSASPICPLLGPAMSSYLTET